MAGSAEDATNITETQRMPKLGQRPDIAESTRRFKTHRLGTFWRHQWLTPGHLEKAVDHRIECAINLIEAPQVGNGAFLDAAVPGLPLHTPSTSVKLPGVQGLRVDVLTPGDVLGAVVTVPELEWCAQTVPFYDYLLEDPEPAAMLAGGHCIPVKLPQAARFVWHKLYASTQRRGFKEKAEKDRQQALVLGGLIANSEAHLLTDAWQAVPPAMAESIRPLSDKLVATAEGHPELQDVFRECDR